jgi:putative oxidoreductase
MEWLVDVLPQVARVCLVAIFPFSGLDKILNWGNALKQAESGFLPGGAVLLILAMMVEFVTPVCIVLGWYDGFAAFVLAGYCVITAILYHDFWKYRRFWSPSSEGYPHLWDFLKNFGLVGGLMLVVLGSDLVAGIAHGANDTAGGAARKLSATDTPVSGRKGLIHDKRDWDRPNIR